MPILYSQKDQNIGVFGLGKTGIAAYSVLKDIANVICYDQKESSRTAFASIYSPQSLVALSSPQWRNLDKIILSPGVPLSHEIVTIANTNNIPITSDIDLLFEESINSNFIAVTGTNGKSTTTTLIAHILTNSNFDYAIGGNIGIPVLSLELQKPGYVLELSSFQLDLLHSFQAQVAVLLNITPDHIDHHKTFEAYIAAKRKIFNRMVKDCYAVINIDNEFCEQILLELQQENIINLIPISTQKILKQGLSIVGNKIYDNIQEEIIIDLPYSKYLQGEHNKQNIAASYATARAIGVNHNNIIKAIQTFSGLPHRMQYIGTIQEVNFYNDSKATNSEAASKSIGSLENIYWLAGGVAKEGGISALVPLFNRIRKAYLFGKDKELFAKTLNDQVDFAIFDNLEQAFYSAYQDAINNNSKQKNILLAPACASLDQFKNFEERGELFIKLCQTKIAEYE